MPLKITDNQVVILIININNLTENAEYLTFKDCIFNEKLRIVSRQTSSNIRLKKSTFLSLNNNMGDIFTLLKISILTQNFILFFLVYISIKQIIYTFKNKFKNFILG